MKIFNDIKLDVSKASQELSAFISLLNTKKDLSEAGDLMPIFKQSDHLCALISTYVPQFVEPDKLAFEFDLFGDFACDIVIGDSKRGIYLLVELEDARPNSIFKQTTKYAPDWSTRLDHGYSQLIDWFWKLEDARQTLDFEHKFSTRSAVFHGLLLIGRMEGMSDREMARLKWRQDRVVVNSNKVGIITFDQLATDLAGRLSYGK